MYNKKSFSVGNEGTATVLRTTDPYRRAQFIKLRLDHYRQ